MLWVQSGSARLNGELVFNPPMGAIDDSLLDLTVSGTRDGILMVESGSREITEAEMVEALVRAEDPIRESCRLQEELRAEAGKDKIVVPDLTFDPQLQAVVRTMVEERLPVVLKDKEKLKKKILDEFKERACLRTCGDLSGQRTGCR